MGFFVGIKLGLIEGRIVLGFPVLTNVGAVVGTPDLCSVTTMLGATEGLILGFAFGAEDIEGEHVSDNDGTAVGVEGWQLGDCDGPDGASDGDSVG